MLATLVNRRVYARYEVRIPIHIAGIGTGWTVDMSALSVAFQIDYPLKPGREIQFDFDLTEESINLLCNGRIVRVEERGPLTFAVASIKDFIVREATER